MKAKKQAGKSPSSKGLVVMKKSEATSTEKTTGVDLAAKHGCSLWVRNIATTTRANDLKAHFSQFGVVSDALLVRKVSCKCALRDASL